MVTRGTGVKESTQSVKKDAPTQTRNCIDAVSRYLATARPREGLGRREVTSRAAKFKTKCLPGNDLTVVMEFVESVGAPRDLRVLHSS